MGFDLFASVRQGASTGLSYAKKGATYASNYVKPGYVLVFSDRNERAYSKELYSYDQALKIRNTIYRIRKNKGLPYRNIRIDTKANVAKRRQERMGQAISLIGTTSVFPTPRSKSKKDPFDIFGGAFQ